MAVGKDGTILTSADGVTWVKPVSSVTPPVTVASGNSEIIGVADKGAILSSIDGVNWVQINWNLKAIIYENGQYLAIGSSCVPPNTGPFGPCVGSIQTSSDGTNWIQRWSGDASDVVDVAYGNGRFVVVGLGSILTSADGINWGLNETDWYLEAITYAKGQFVSDGLGTLLTSADGVNWIQRWSGDENDVLNGVAYCNSQFVAVGYSHPDGANFSLTSADGVNWVMSPPGLNTALSAIAYGEKQFVAVGKFGVILTSPDGAIWTQRQSGTQNTLSAVACGNGQFVAVGGYFNGITEGGQSTILTSPDAVNWARSEAGSLTDTYSPTGIAYGNGPFVVVGNSFTHGSGTILTSVDGTNWVQRESGTQVSLNAIVYGNGRFVAGGSTGALLTSTHGVSWSQSLSLSLMTNGLSSIAFGNGRFVALGLGELVHNIGYYVITATSTDGLTWVQQQMPFAPGAFTPASIAYGNGQFVAVGPGGQDQPGTIITSADGLSWVQRQSGGLRDNGLQGIAYGNGHFVAVDDGGMILESGPIINLSITPNPDAGLLLLSLDGPTGLGYKIQSSTDLISWRNVTNITSTQATNMILTEKPPGSDHLFYRAYSP